MFDVHPSGTYGAGISLCSEGKEMDQLCDIQDKCNTDIMALPGKVYFTV